MLDTDNILNNFLSSNHRNDWLLFKDMRVYVRARCQRILGGEHYSTFDIANVTVNAGKKNQGIFTEFMSRVEQLAGPAGMEAVYVESVMNPRLATFLQRRGYAFATPYDKESPCPNFFKLTDESKSNG